MILRKNKKAQYYLLAAAVIVAVLIGVSFVTNYAITRKRPMRFYALSYELKEEATRVMDYAIYNGMDVNELMQDFIEDFIKYAAGTDVNINFLFVYGNSSGIKIVIYTNDTLNTGRMSYETVFEDSEADFVCNGETIDNLNLNNQNVLLKNCIVTGVGEAVQVTGGNLKIISSDIAGNILAKGGTNLELIDSTIGGKVEGRLGGNIFIINNIIGDKIFIKDEGGTLFITDNIIAGALEFACSEIYQVEDNDFNGGTQCIEKTKNNIKIELLDNTYDFNLNEGENFFFTMVKEVDGEIYISKGEL